MQTNVGSTTAEPLLTVKQFCVKEPAFTEASLRWMLFNRETNGLVSSGAVVQIGRKLLLDRPAFIRWAKSNPRTMLERQKVAA